LNFQNVNAMRNLTTILGILLVSVRLYGATPYKEVRTVDSLQRVVPAFMSDNVSNTDNSSEKKLSKIEQKTKKVLKKKAVKAGVTVEDIIAFVGVVIMVLGAISLIFNLVGGLVTIVVGLAIYLVGKSLGGSVNRFFK